MNSPPFKISLLENIAHIPLVPAGVHMAKNRMRLSGILSPHCRQDMCAFDNEVLSISLDDMRGRDQVLIERIDEFGHTVLVHMDVAEIHRIENNVVAVDVFHVFYSSSNIEIVSLRSFRVPFALPYRG